MTPACKPAQVPVQAMAAGMGLIGTGGRRVTACGTSRPQLPSSIHTTLSTAHDQNPDPTRYKTDFSEPLRTIEIKSNGELQMEFNAQMEVKHCVTGGLAHRSGVRTSFKLVAFQGMKICDGFTRDEIITRIQREPRPWRFTFGNCQSATVDAGSAKCASAVDPEILHKTEPSKAGNSCTVNPDSLASTVQASKRTGGLSAMSSAKTNRYGGCDASDTVHTLRATSRAASVTQCNAEQQVESAQQGKAIPSKVSALMEPELCSSRKEFACLLPELKTCVVETTDNGDAQKPCRLEVDL